MLAVAGIVHHGIGQIYVAAQCLTDLAQILSPHILFVYKDLSQKRAEAAGGQVGVITVVLLQLPQFGKIFCHRGALPGILCPDLIHFLAENAQLQLGSALILGIDQSLIVAKGHIHTGAVADVLVIHPGLGLNGVEGAGTFAGNLLRLVQAHQQQRQKGHIVA